VDECKPLIMGNFFILNLFIGIILDNFAQLSSEAGDGGRVSQMLLATSKDSIE